MTETDIHVAELLLKALRSLPEAERNRVLTALIESALTPVAARTATRAVMPSLAPTEGLFPHGKLELAGGAGLVPLPVRLSAHDYERLKAWSAKHGFPMAVIIRGLVERFLDSQQQPE